MDGEIEEPSIGDMGLEPEDSSVESDSSVEKSAPSPAEIRDKILEPEYLPERKELEGAFIEMDRNERDRWVNENEVFEILKKEYIEKLGN